MYANVRPCKSIPGYKTLYDNVDTVLIRENTEGEYSGIEHEVIGGVMQSIKLITKEASLRIADYAFQLANQIGRKNVTVVHKATIMRASDGLFVAAVQEIAKKYPNIQLDDISLDRAVLYVRKQKLEKKVILFLDGTRSSKVLTYCNGHA